MAAIAALVLLAPAAAIGAECEGDECQAPPPPPAEIVPGTATVNAPGNPPVRFPAQHRKRHRHHSHKAKR